MKICWSVTELWSVQECIYKISKTEYKLKGHYSETKKQNATITVRATSSWPNIHSNKVACMYIKTTTELWCAQ